ncbi:hypothetical protein GCM10009780_57570 [Actinomadura alba]
MLNWVGGLSVVRQDGTAQYLGALAQQMGTEYGQLARGRQGAPLVVAAGHLYTLSLSGKPRLDRVKLPMQVEGKAEVAVAVAGQSQGTFLIATKAAVVAVHDGSVIRTWKIRSTNDPHDSIPTSLAPDGSGGAWVGISAAGLGYITHLRRDGAVRAVLNSAGSDCTASPPPQPQQQTRIAKEFPLRRPTALLIHNNQLYVADRDCSRIVALGLPIE